VRDAALDFGGFCADLLTGLAFVGMPGKLLRSKAGCKGAIVRIAAARHRAEGHAVPFIKTDRIGKAQLIARASSRQGRRHRPGFSWRRAASAFLVGEGDERERPARGGAGVVHRLAGFEPGEHTVDPS
jgi:hypothetical protein